MGLTYVVDRWHRELPPESPPQFGLHPNAEIGYLTNATNTLFNTILSISGSSDSGGGGGGTFGRMLVSLRTSHFLT
jgi:dynein heavy chain